MKTDYYTSSTLVSWMRAGLLSQGGWDRMAPVGAVGQGQLAAQDFFAYQAHVPDGGVLQ